MIESDYLSSTFFFSVPGGYATTWKKKVGRLYDPEKEMKKRQKVRKSNLL